MARLVVADNEPDILDPTVARLRARGHEVRTILMTAFLLSKPFDADALLGALARALER